MVKEILHIHCLGEGRRGQMHFGHQNNRYFFLPIPLKKSPPKKGKIKNLQHSKFFSKPSTMLTFEEMSSKDECLALFLSTTFSKALILVLRAFLLLWRPQIFPWCWFFNNLWFAMIHLSDNLQRGLQLITCWHYFTTIKTHLITQLWLFSRIFTW